MSWALSAHRWVSTLIVAAGAMQFFLAGAGAFGATDFDLHVAIGRALIAAALVALGLAALGRRHVRMTTVVLLLLVVQWVLGKTGSEEEPWLGALHGLNALAVMGVAGAMTGRTWRATRGEAAG